MPRQIIIDIKDGQTGNPAVRMARPLSLTVCDGEQVAVVGDNAAGKTRLVETLSGILGFRKHKVHRIPRYLRWR